MLLWRIGLVLVAACINGADTTAELAKLAVVTNFSPDDADKVAQEMEVRWSLLCPPEARSKVQADLVLYYTRVEDDIARRVLSQVPARVSNCFRNVRVICSDLTEEQDEYLVGPDHQFFRIYLHPDVAPRFKEYGAFAFVGFDCYITRPRALEELLDAAFGLSGLPEYYVKGGSMVGIELHDTARDRKHYGMLGHITGNGLYTLSDPKFYEFVNYTTTLYPPAKTTLYPFDVALWAVIAKFPYSWPLWQRYLHLFIHSDLFINVGLIDSGDLSKQKAAFVHSTTDVRASLGESEDVSWETSEFCPDGCIGHHPAVCDATCLEGPKQRWGGYNCQHQQGPRTQACRRCYKDVTEALAADAAARVNGSHVIMCDTRMPPIDPSACPDECGSYKADVEGELKMVHGAKDTICDLTCSSDSVGYGCGAAALGQNCRFCFAHEQECLLTGNATAQAVMCSSLAPPAEEMEEAAAEGRILKDREDMYFLDIKHDDGRCRGWPCKRDCITNFRHTGMGRRCDLTCLDHPPSYNGIGCNEDQEGCACRLCYNDVDEALRVTLRGEMALMCDTLRPPNIYARPDRAGKSKKYRRLQKDENKDSEVAMPFPLQGLCVFMRAYPPQMPLVNVGVQSARTHVPEAKIVVAVGRTWYKDSEAAGLGFNVSDDVVEHLVPEEDFRHKYAEMWADELCGRGTNYIYYLPPGTAFTRTPEFLDVRRPLGELLVSHVGFHLLPQETILWRNQNLALLGWPTPCFTHGQDVVLPVALNGLLRDRLWERGGNIARQFAVFGNDFHAVELLAGFAYGMQLEGVKFQDATEWGKSHIIVRPQSIWEIPLIKPPYTCRGDVKKNLDLLQELRRAHRGTLACPHGWIYTPEEYLD